MKNVAVYCSSRSGLPEEVEQIAQGLGKLLGESGSRLVYGGVNAGLMHTLASAAREAGAEVCGIVPEVFRERVDACCTEVHYTRDLNERKARMIEMADLFVVLPGGIGTIDEWISTLSHIKVMEKKIPGYDKPIIAVDLHGMYAGLREQLRLTSESVYGRGSRIDRTLYAADEQALLSILTPLLTEA